MKKALITGVTGQDGAYLSEFLLGKGFRGAGRGDDRGRPSGGRARSPGEVERLSGLCPA